MKVLHIITDLQTGGAELMLARLLEGLRATDLQSEVLCLGPGGPVVERIRDSGVPVTVIGIKMPRPTPRQVVCLLTSVRRARPDLIQGWMYHANLAAQIAAATLPVRIPVLWNIRRDRNNSSEKRSTRAMIWMGARLSPRAAAILYNSHAAKRSHELAGFSSRNSLVIPNGFSTDLFRPSAEARASVRRELGVPANATLYGLIARYAPVKNQPSFLRAAAIAAQAVPNAAFLLVGRDVSTNPELRSLAASLGLQSRVTLLNERRDLPRLTAALDVAISSSYVEGFSNTLGEAMSCAIPCVATDVGDSRRLVGETGILVPPLDTEALAAALIQIGTLPTEVRNRMGSAARERVRQDFSLGATSLRYECLYRKFAPSNTHEFSSPIVGD